MYIWEILNVLTFNINEKNLSALKRKRKKNTVLGKECRQQTEERLFPVEEQKEEKNYQFHLNLGTKSENFILNYRGVALNKVTPFLFL